MFYLKSHEKDLYTDAGSYEREQHAVCSQSGKHNDGYHIENTYVREIDTENSPLQVGTSTTDTAANTIKDDNPDSDEGEYSGNKILMSPDFSQHGQSPKKEVRFD